MDLLVDEHLLLSRPLQDPGRDLYGLLHASREKLCLAQMAIAPREAAHVARLDEAVRQIDTVGSAVCPQWSRFGQAHQLPLRSAVAEREGPRRRPLHQADLDVAREHERLGNYEAAAANAQIAATQYLVDEDRSRASALRARGPG